jgi:hypothetical protein
MQTGTVSIYFKEEQTNEEYPVPQLRADIDVLEKAGSTWLSNALLYGTLVDDEESWAIPGSPESLLSPLALSPNFSSPPGQRFPSTSPSAQSPPPFHMSQQYYGVPSSSTAPTSPYYSDVYPRSQSPPSFESPGEQKATHELWFTAPAHVKTPQGQRLHHVAIRNYLAMLHNKPIVGAEFYEMLLTLQPEIQVMYDLDHDEHSRISSNERSVQMVTNYLTKYKLDDVRKSIKQAMCLLAWAELDNVKWKQGYLETFVHLTGVLCPELEEVPEFKRLSLVTRRNLGIASKQLQLRVMDAEEKLGPFDFEDLWFDTTKVAGHPVYQSYQAFRHFLGDYYTRIYGNWPPVHGKSWLNRKMVIELQNDFGALYDYLVNRDVMWDSREERPGKKWKMVNRKSEDFRADRPDLSVTDMLVTFDNKHGYLHIPHPYPLLPREVPQSKPVPQKKGLFGLKKSSKAVPAKDAKTHLQLSIIYSDATNIEKLDDSFHGKYSFHLLLPQKTSTHNPTGSALIDAFERFELSADLKANTTPHEARLGRWILLYGILQCLSTLSVDVLSLRHTDGVRYFLNTELKRLPEWVTNGEPEKLEAGQTRSWCWQRSWDPTPVVGAPVELDGESVGAVRSMGMGRPGEMDAVAAAMARGDTNTSATAYSNPSRGMRRDSDYTGLPATANIPTTSNPNTNNNASHDGSARLQNDIRRIGEKIDHLSLSPQSQSQSQSQQQQQQQQQQQLQQSLSQSPHHYHHHQQPPSPHPYSNPSTPNPIFSNADPSTPRLSPCRRDPEKEDKRYDYKSPDDPTTQQRKKNKDTTYRLTESDYATRPMPDVPGSAGTSVVGSPGSLGSSGAARSPGPPGYTWGGGGDAEKREAESEFGRASSLPRTQEGSHERIRMINQGHELGGRNQGQQYQQHEHQNQNQYQYQNQSHNQYPDRSTPPPPPIQTQIPPQHQHQNPPQLQPPLKPKHRPSREALAYAQNYQQQMYPQRVESRGYAATKEKGGWQYADDTSMI